MTGELTITCSNLKMLCRNTEMKPIFIERREFALCSDLLNVTSPNHKTGRHILTDIMRMSTYFTQKSNSILAVRLKDSPTKRCVCNFI